MPSHVAVVSASRVKKHGKRREHAHPVREMRIKPADNGGFTSETEMHPPPQDGENSMYQPGQILTGAHKSAADLMKHVKSTMVLKDDQQEGNGMTDPGSAEDVEDKE